jgi:hypothetical protein
MIEHRLEWRYARAIDDNIVLLVLPDIGNAKHRVQVIKYDLPAGLDNL